jgi:hypothetical protein
MEVTIIFFYFHLACEKTNTELCFSRDYGWPAVCLSVSLSVWPSVCLSV